MRSPFTPTEETYKNTTTGEIVKFYTSWNVCFGWAIWKWLTCGGYLVLRRARLCVPMWHFMWMPEEGSQLYHFIPIHESTRIPWPVFKGYIKKGEWNDRIGDSDDKVYERVVL